MTIEHCKDPEYPSEELKLLRREKEAMKRDLELKYEQTVKKEWVKDVKGLPTILRVKLEIEYRTYPMSLDEIENPMVQHSGETTSMAFTQHDIRLVAPLLNIKAFDQFILGELGTAEKE